MIFSSDVGLEGNMKDIKLLRDEINEIDDKLLELLEKRYQVSKSVGEYKQENALEIFVKNREEEILDKVGSNSTRSTITRNLFASVMRQSRQIQYQDLVKVDGFNGLDFIYDNKVSEADIETLVCLGPKGTNSCIAAKQFANKTIVEVDNFVEVCKSVDSKKGCYGVLPIENTTEGVVNQVYDLLVKYKLFVVDDLQLNVANCLIGSADSIDEIKYVSSHPQALAQCRNYISTLNVKTLQVSSTSLAVAQSVGKREYAAIANEVCADLYDLKILKKDINDEEINMTKFVLVSDIPHISQKTKGFMFAFTIPHQAGTLSTALQMFSDYGLSLNSLVSRPVLDKPFEYRFYVEVIGDLNDIKVKALMYQLKQELLSIQFLGSIPVK
ncbi:MAG: chorismate mutase [Clostridiales bacterium]|jgi:chorismate mutase/prephenate dehydratase|nr:chorismate mutase [Clostridiales bacterium]